MPTPADGALGFAKALTNLQQLDLSGCRDLAPSSLEPLAPLSGSLACLRLQHCTGLRGPGALAPLCALTALTQLNLGGCTGLHGQALRALRLVLGLVLTAWRRSCALAGT